MKICSSCAEAKPLDQFSKNRSKADGYSGQCKTCTATYRQTRKPLTKVSNRRYNLARYGLTPEAYAQMVEEQGYRCAICGQPQDSKISNNLYIDHDHSCCPGIGSCGNCIRGLLCSGCNSALGYVKDDPKILQSMISYLKGAP